ncbi:MAG: alpha/beta hydrolase [Ruminococcaceae bacterium]|nr:alpha/beta hydrolase [Oscillospiraceae bacterium]
MQTQTFTFSKGFSNATLTSYIHDTSPEMPMPPRRAIIVCPGGGYGFLSDREAEPIALQYFAAGLNSFVLRYSIGDKARDFTPLTEAALAIAHVRLNAEIYNIDANYVFITGFSAGGHLAASAGTLWKLPLLNDRLKVELGDYYVYGVNRPTATLPCYPVITAGEYTHRGSINNLCGKSNPTEEEINAYSLELHVDADTAPAFLWHTFDDSCVPIQNTLLYVEALTRAKVRFECHIYPHGNHGLSLCNKETWANNPGFINTTCEGWMALAIRYVKEF